MSLEEGVEAIVSTIREGGHVISIHRDGDKGLLNKAFADPSKDNKSRLYAA